MFRQRMGTLLVLLITVAATTMAGSAAEVEVGVSTREAQVGVPLTLFVIIEYEEGFDAPIIPEIAGATLDPNPGTQSSSVTQFVNGRTTQRTTITFNYRLTPAAPGVVTIGEIVVNADGKTYSSRPFDLVVNAVGESARLEGTEELLIVEVETGRESIILGEPVVARLRIFVRPYRDRVYRRTLSEEEMWRMIAVGESTWGPFADSLRELAAQRRRPRGQEELRESGDGARHRYYLYELEATVWPQQAGAQSFGDVTVIVDYPTRLRRDFFDLRVAESRRLVAAADVPDFTILSPPEERRPPVFRGAVGRFDIVATARPTEVTVGDPITLTLTVTDRAVRPSQLEVLQPPPLHVLDADFRVPSDPLAGLVEGSQKTFTQTIRARSDAVREIPPIPFAFYDPERRAYRTVRSDPIPLTVTPATRLALSDVVDAATGTPDTVVELTETTGGLLANYTDPDDLLRDQRLELGWPAWLVLLAGPLLFATTTLSHRWYARRRDDTALLRRRQAKRRALGRLREIRATGPGAEADAIVAALHGYVADRVDVPSGALTRAEAIRYLETGHVNAELIGEVADLLSACERQRYAGRSEGDLGRLAERATRAIDRLERERLG